MKKIKISSVLAAGVAAAVQINNNQAFSTPPPDTTTFTTSSDYSSGSSFEVPISPAIVNADGLVSISEGNAGFESGSFTLTVDFSNQDPQQIYSGELPVDFVEIPTESFGTGDVTGLTFAITGGGNNESLPSGTVFTFDVPEPASLSMIAVGGAGAWLAARRRTGKQG